MTRWDEIKAARREQNPHLDEGIAQERRLLEQEQVEHQIAERRKDKAFMARIRAMVKRDKAVLDRLRDS